jgi:Fe2+ transport system protein B
MNRKIDRRTRRMATQVIDFNPNDINKIEKIETTGKSLCKTDQNQLNSQISLLFKHHRKEGAEITESVNCVSKNVIKEEKKNETNKQEQIHSTDADGNLVSHKAIAVTALKLEEDKVVSERLCKKEATERKDFIKQSTDEKEKVKNNTMSTILVDLIPLQHPSVVNRDNLLLKIC